MMKKLDTLRLEIARLTRQTHALGIPMMIIFEGVPGFGKNEINERVVAQFRCKVHKIYRDENTIRV